MSAPKRLPLASRIAAGLAIEDAAPAASYIFDRAQSLRAILFSVLGSGTPEPAMAAFCAKISELASSSDDGRDTMRRIVTTQHSLKNRNWSLTSRTNSAGITTVSYTVYVAKDDKKDKEGKEGTSKDTVTKASAIAAANEATARAADLEERLRLLQQENAKLRRALRVAGVDPSSVLAPKAKAKAPKAKATAA